MISVWSGGRRAAIIPQLTGRRVVDLLAGRRSLILRRNRTNLA